MVLLKLSLVTIKISINTLSIKLEKRYIAILILIVIVNTKMHPRTMWISAYSTRDFQAILRGNRDMDEREFSAQNSKVVKG